MGYLSPALAVRNMKETIEFYIRDFTVEDPNGYQLTFNQRNTSIGGS